MTVYNHNSATFIGRGGNETFFQSWIAPNPSGVMVISHGVGEHSGRYGNIVEELDGKGISVYALDHRGHGKSGGKKGHIDYFADYIYDLKLFIDYIKEQNPGKPLVLMGHSMGGLIACRYALEYQQDLTGLVLSSAFFKIGTKVPALKLAAGKVLSKYIPSLTMPNGLIVEDISRDPETVKKYINDPLVHNKISARWATEVFSAIDLCLNRATELTLPILFFSGTADKIVDYTGSQEVYNKVSSSKKEIILYEGLYHETMNEVEVDKKKVLANVSRWLLELIGSKKASPKKKAAVKKKPAAKKKTAIKKKAAAKKKPATKKKAAAKKKPAAKKKAVTKKKTATKKKPATQKSKSKKTVKKKK